MDQCVVSDEQKVRMLKTHAEPRPEDFVCYKKAVKIFSKSCYNVGQVSFHMDI